MDGAIRLMEPETRATASYEHPLIGAGQRSRGEPGGRSIVTDKVLRRPSAGCGLNSRTPLQVAKQRKRLAGPPPLRFTPDPVRANVLTGMILLSRGDAQIVIDNHTRQQDISLRVLRSWYDLVFGTCTASDLVVGLRRLERAANPMNHGWRYRSGCQAGSCAPITGALEAFGQCSLKPLTARQLVSAVVILAGHVPNPLIVGGSGELRKKIPIPAVTGEIADKVEYLLGPQLEHVRGIMT